ncbi:MULTISPECIES: hypothetical protein [Vibrio]|uniref:hypothetical protein n=1 Tax=Vibrio TaxID=662 RepID=UPI001EFC4DE5|nr:MULTISPECIES: hypothetical protein [Vibrio]MCG9677783.1 hypothetical protein [Vibrio sp. Isolate24]USD34645.1 hypothetical protein J8Z27_21740 [Vibrio sp. SCSIO 43186]USD47712.1 hypothetical protein J4N38_22135 [Vibrio sp. SCSIO 43145]USD71770.1 hypothetical protein J4N41_21755 [Vibrio sp. SCSIO 43139]USD98673.1 hypothetical protein CTT30_21945 [Vibrio coralliilyticus]
MILSDMALWLSLTYAFSLNILIAISAMTIGFPLGALLSRGANHSQAPVKWLAKGVQSLLCNVPSFVMLFYLALIVPSRWEMMGFEMYVPALGKAIIALAIPVMGYSCDLATQKRTSGRSFSLSAVNQFFLVILMASTTASAIGVDEILATSNSYIASSGKADAILPIYTMVACFFIVSGALCQSFLKTFIALAEKRQHRHVESGDQS